MAGLGELALLLFFGCIPWTACFWSSSVEQVFVHSGHESVRCISLIAVTAKASKMTKPQAGSSLA